MLCLIFDFDGTLVDSEPLHNQAFLDLLPHLNDSVPGLTQRYRGVHLPRVLADLALRVGHALPEDFETTYRARVAQLYDESLAPMPGAMDVLSRLPHEKCVASNGPLAKTRHGLRVSGIDHFFGDNIFSAYQVGHWKPEPHLFLHAARAMNSPPERCLVVEDSEAGLQAAEAAGIRAIYYCPHGTRPSTAVHACVKRLEELPEVIRRAGHAA